MVSDHSPLAARHSPLPLAFCGIHVISPRLLTLITESGAFSIIDTYLRLAIANEKISAFRADSFYWRDLGRTTDLQEAATDIAQGLSG
jgi:NDP-sugar pyrophosphorylase family protein